MKQFNVFKSPTRGMEAVKVGFSWPALFFGVIWMLLKKLWGVAALWMTVCIAFALIEEVTDRSEASLVQASVYFFLAAGYFALWLIPAFKGNKWREQNLTKRGFELVSTVEAETTEGAIAQVVKPAVRPAMSRPTVQASAD